MAMKNTYYNAIDDEESSLLDKKQKFASFALEVDQVDQQYVNTTPQTSSFSKSALMASKFALAVLILLLFIATYPLASQYLLGATGDAALKEKNTKPNFVFMLIDDASWNSMDPETDIGFATPFIQGMISKGITLENYYSQQMCTPARAALMTGRYPISLGMQYGAIESKSTWGVPLEEVLLPEALRDFGGYKSYGLGKWNLGHFTPQYLPTARGFDYFLGFLNSGSYYWSKKDPSDSDWFDFMISDRECYDLYEGKDFETYSTDFYTAKAVQAIEKHNFDDQPMFLYMSYQAAHDPWHDHNAYETGVTGADIGENLYNFIQENVVGGERQQYAISLSILDKSVSTIHDAITTAGQLDNTYFIIVSDNGGCFAKGGRNGPLRGSKSSLFEGGTKVFGYVYNAGLSAELQGTSYKGLFHVTDWLPTILGLSGFDYTSTGRNIDGIDQSAALMTPQRDTYPRNYIMYNMIVNVEGKDFDIETNAPFAYRNPRYKLIHAYLGNEEAKTYFPTDQIEDDDNFYSGSACTESRSLAGVYTKYLFDLVNDPYETNNLYHNAKYLEIRDELYAAVGEFKVKVELETDDCDEGVHDDNWELSECEPVWRGQDKMIQPWDFTVSELAVSDFYPRFCESKGNIFGYSWKDGR